MNTGIGDAVNLGVETRRRRCSAGPAIRLLDSYESGAHRLRKASCRYGPRCPPRSRALAWTARLSCVCGCSFAPLLPIMFRTGGGAPASCSARCRRSPVNYRGGPSERRMAPARYTAAIGCRGCLWAVRAIGFHAARLARFAQVSTAKRARLKSACGARLAAASSLPWHVPDCADRHHAMPAISCGLTDTLRSPIRSASRARSAPTLTRTRSNQFDFRDHAALHHERNAPTASISSSGESRTAMMSA